MISMTIYDQTNANQILIFAANKVILRIQVLMSVWCLALPHFWRRQEAAHWSTETAVYGRRIGIISVTGGHESLTHVLIGKICHCLG